MSSDNKGIMTHSGAMVSPWRGVPTLEDIALSLSRLPRFAGHTRRPWSVLQHSFVVERMAQLDGESSQVRLVALMHDWHESITGDVPSPMKGYDMADLQDLLDLRIYDAYFPGGADASLHFRDKVHALDKRVLLAEAVVVGPPGINMSNVGELFGGEPIARDCTSVRTVEQFIGNWPDRLVLLFEELTANIETGGNTREEKDNG